MKSLTIGLLQQRKTANKEDNLRRMAEAIPGAALEVITSNFGHDGFLLEWQQISDCINKHFELFRK